MQAADRDPSSNIRSTSSSPSPENQRHPAADPPPVRRPIPEDQFAKFAVDSATRCAVEMVTACAVDGRPFWEVLFEQGMADAISEDLQIESDFLGRLCSQPGLPFAAVIVKAYLEQMPEDRKAKLFNPAALKKKGHPFGACFYGASFMTPCGANLLAVLKVLIADGLSLQPLIERNYNEVERATALCNRPFLAAITAGGGVLDDDIIRAVMTRSGKQVEAVSMLIDDCHVPIEKLMLPKLMTAAKPETRAYLNARAVRERRVPECARDPEDDDGH